MKRALFIFPLLLGSYLFAQTDVENSGHIIDFDRTVTLNQKSVSTSQFSMQSMPMLLPAEFPAMNTPAIFYNDQKIYFPEFSKQSSFIQNLSDFNLSNQYYLNNRSFITTGRSNINLTGIGGLRFVEANYNRKLGDFGIISGGIYGSKFNIYNNFYNDAGVNGNIKIIVNDRISLNMFGQYSLSGKQLNMPLIAPLYPHTYYGGSFEFKVNENWGLDVGATREFDVLRRKWVTSPFIMPVFFKH